MKKKGTQKPRSWKEANLTKQWLIA